MYMKHILPNILKCFILGHLLSLVSSIQLEGLSTKRPRVTKYQLKTTPSTLLDPNAPTNYEPPSTPSSISIFRVNTTNGVTCILLKTDALVTIQYRDKLGEDLEADSFILDNAVVSGNCKYEDTAEMSITWKGFNLNWGFAKTPGGERWYVNKIELSYSTSNVVFKHVDKPKVNLVLATPQGHSTLLFPTPVGKSYICDEKEIVVELKNYNENIETTQSATLLLRELKLQAFMYKADNSFGPPFECNLSRGTRSEATPIAVGSTLAIAVLGTVTGYGVFRYLKVKKVQYGTME